MLCYRRYELCIYVRVYIAKCTCVHFVNVFDASHTCGEHYIHPKHTKNTRETPTRDGVSRNICNRRVKVESRPVIVLRQ